MCDDLSALKSMWWLMQIFHWFSFPNFLLVQFSSPHQVQFGHLCVATVKTFMLGYLCVMTILYLKVRRKICQNRLTHLCVPMVNRLGDWRVTRYQLWTGVHLLYSALYSNFLHSLETIYFASQTHWN